MLRQPLFGQPLLRNRLAMVIVGNNAEPRVEVRTLKPVQNEGSRDDLAAEPFTEADHKVGRTRRQFADGADAAQQVVQRVEVVLNGAEQRAQFDAMHQVSGRFQVPRTQARAQRQRSGFITPARGCRGCQ